MAVIITWYITHFLRKYTVAAVKVGILFVLLTTIAAVPTTMPVTRYMLGIHAE